MKSVIFSILGAAIFAAACPAAAIRGHLETDGLPAYLEDRGEGIPLSIFGTYVQKGQLIVYPFLDHYRDANYE